MKIHFHRQFDKQYSQLKGKEKDRAQQRLALFLNNPFDSRLRNHPLQGRYLNYRSINITGDLRAIYKQVGADESIFVAIGTHSQLY